MKTIHKDGCGGEMKGKNQSPTGLFAKQAKRPPPVSKGVANDLYQKGPRSAQAPRPTKDTGYTRKG